MIVDSSALLAIILEEPEGERFASAVFADPRAMMSIASYVEVVLKVDRKRAAPDPVLDATIEWLGIALTPVSVEQGKLARVAFNRFGKGRDAAKLNFGDCLTYALAKDSGEPLLCKGDDFSQTDLTLVFPPERPAS